jgi:hypothetical protein
MVTETSVRWGDTAGTGPTGGTGDDMWRLVSVLLALAGYGRRVRWAKSCAFDCGGQPIRQDRVPRETDTGHTGRQRLLADGGQPEAQPEAQTRGRQQRLQQIFQELTDSGLLVERQSADSRRCLDDDEKRLTEEVADIAESDGLSDAISAPERTDGSERQ